MIQKLFGVVTGVLALNFLAVAGVIAYLVATHKLDQTKAHAIRDLLAGPATQPATQPSTRPATQPSPDDAPLLRLAPLLDRYARRPAAEQADLVHTALESQAATVERRFREMQDQRAQVEAAQAELAKKEAALAAHEKAFDDKVAEQGKLAGDENFQKALSLYQAMPAKQIKTYFAGMDDDTVVRFLRAMDERQAAGILKEFKTPVESKRALALMEKVRQAPAPSE